MIKYNSCEPLILIHIPKTAGQSVKEIYKCWYEENLYFHYFNRSTNCMPRKYDIDDLQKKHRSVFFYGHFNRSGGFGVEDYYPSVKQFITIIRDPFEMAISGFFYVKKTNPDWRIKLNLPEGELIEYLQKMHSGLLHFFPSNITIDNYKEIIEAKFIEIGVTEYLEESMIRIAERLSQEYIPGSLGRLNASFKNQEIPYSLKDSFIERHQLEYAIYDYVLTKYK